jgi:hypothetical protein
VGGVYGSNFIAGMTAAVLGAVFHWSAEAVAWLTKDDRRPSAGGASPSDCRVNRRRPLQVRRDKTAAWKAALRETALGAHFI